MQVGDLVIYKPTGEMGMVVRMEKKPALPTDREWVYVSWIGNDVAYLDYGQLSGYPKSDLGVVCK